MDWYSLPLHCGKELIHGYIGIILIEAEKELSLQIDSKINETQWKVYELVKDHYFKSIDK